MNFDLTEDQRKLQATVADFAQSEVAPVAEALDRDGVFPTELFKKAGELGITAIPFSEDLGGMGLGVLDMVIALEQLAHADQSLAVSVMVSVASGLTLGRFGDTELARKYLPDIIAGRKICGIAGTEPNAGSDTSAFTTRASQRGKRLATQWREGFHHQWRDRHQFVSDDPCRLVAAGCGEEVIHAFSRSQRRARIHAGERYRKMGWRSSDTRPYYLQDCDIDQDHIIGPVHGGRIVLHRGYQQARVFLAACSLGLAQACLDHSLTFAKERKAFGGPIGRLQLVQEMIAQMALQIDAARLLTYRAAWNVDQGRTDLKQLAMAKLYACEAGTKCADLAIQVHGGWGYMDDCPVSRYYRDNRICTIGDGSTQIQTLLIARESGLEAAFA